MNILIVKLSAIGDVILSLPFLASLRKKYPRAHLTWLVEEAAADILLDHPDLDQVMVSRRKSWIKNLKKGEFLKTARDVSAFLQGLHARKYDLAIDLQGLFKSGILTFLSRSPRRIGFDASRELSYLFVNERLAPYDPDRHALKRYLDVAAYLGADINGADRYVLPRDPKAARQAEELMPREKGLKVALNPGAKWPSKLWPLEAWRRLSKILAGQAGYRVFLTGGPDEKEVNGHIGAGINGLIDLTGRTGLKVLAEVYRLMDVVICPDTGPMHLAAAVNTPVVALFGPTAPWRTGPYGPGHVVLRTGIHCSPCFKKKCPHPECLTDIDEYMVFQAVQGILARS